MIHSTSRRALVAATCLAALAIPQAAARTHRADIVVYGCTSGGVTAAIQTKRMGKSVQMVCPEKHLGGLTAQVAGLPVDEHQLPLDADISSERAPHRAVLLHR